MRFLLLLCCLAAPRLLWAGDAPFIADEPRFLKLALESAERGELPRHSLRSTRGPYHGLLVVWLHRAGLSVTRDLETLHFVRILLFTAGLVASLYGLSRIFPGLPPWALMLPLLSPFFWLRSRDLWDNSLLVPLTAGTLTAYLAFLNDGRFRWLLTAALCGTLAFLTHLMALPLLGRASGYGPSLKSQLRAIRELKGAPFELGERVENPYLPLSLGVLRDLYGPVEGPERVVEYAHPERPGGARLRVNESP